MENRLVSGGLRERLQTAQRRRWRLRQQRSARHRRGHSRVTPPFLKFGCGSSALLPLGESGASSVKGEQGRVQAARSAAWMRLIETGRSPGTNSAGTRMTVGAHVVTLAGSCFCPGQLADRLAHVGVRGTGRPSSQHVVFQTACRSVHGDRRGLDRSRRPGRSHAPGCLRPRAESATPPWRRLPDLRNRTRRG